MVAVPLAPLAPVLILFGLAATATLIQIIKQAGLEAPLLRLGERHQVAPPNERRIIESEATQNILTAVREAPLGPFPEVEIQHRQALVAELQETLARKQAAVLAFPEVGEVGGTTVFPRDIPQAPTAPGAVAIGAGVAAGIGALSAEAIQHIGLNFHRGTLGSQTTTAALLQTLLSGALSVGAIAAVNTDAWGTRTFLRDALASHLRFMLNRDKFSQPLTDERGEPLTEQAQTSAADLVIDRLVFGLQAHVLATTAELATPLKYMGINQIAAFLSDLAGFQRIAQNLLSPYESAGIERPLRLDANRRFRTEIPDLNLINLYYAKKELSPSQMARFVAFHGLSDFWVGVNELAAFLDPRLTEIVRISQFFRPSLTPGLERPTADVVRWWDGRPEWTRIFEENGVSRDRILGPDWWLYYKLAKGGYEVSDVIVLVEVAKRATARREQSMFLAAATSLHRDGFIGSDEYRRLIDEGWDLTDPKSARVRAAELSARHEELRDTRDVVLRTMSKGALTPMEVRSHLEALGIRPTIIRLLLLKERLGLLPSPRAVRVPEEPEIMEEPAIPMG